MPVYKMGHAFGEDAKLPDGPYDSKIISHDYRQGKFGPFIHVKFKIMDHPEFKGRIYGENFSDSEKYIWKFEKLLTTCGYGGQTYNTEDREFLDKNLKNRMVRIVLETRIGERGPMQRIGNFYRIDTESDIIQGEQKRNADIEKVLASEVEDNA